MNPDKQIILDDVVRHLNASPFLIVIDYTGLTVDQFAELRSRLKKSGAQCHVIKNSYSRRAAAEIKLPEELSGALVGQTAIVTGDAEVAAAAKTLRDFKKEFEKPSSKAGVLDGAYLDEASLLALADLPTRPELLAKFLGLLNQPATSFARILNEPAASLARVLKAKADKG